MRQISDSIILKAYDHIGVTGSGHLIRKHLKILKNIHIPIALEMSNNGKLVFPPKGPAARNQQ
jgi:hypothetical protein